MYLLGTANLVHQGVFKAEPFVTDCICPRVVSCFNWQTEWVILSSQIVLFELFLEAWRNKMIQ